MISKNVIKFPFHIFLLYHILMMRVLNLYQRKSTKVQERGDFLRHGRNCTRSKSSQMEGRISLSSPMKEQIGETFKVLAFIHNNMMWLLEMKIFWNPQSFVIFQCISKNQLVNGGQVSVLKDRHQRLGNPWGLRLWSNSYQVMPRTKYSPNGGVCVCNLTKPFSGT